MTSERKKNWDRNRGFLEIGDTNRFNLENYVVDTATGCHLWQGAISDNGYAIVGTNRDGTFRAARVAYERKHGPLGTLMPDHSCRRRRCINPDHLEPVTNRVNSQRGARAKLTPEDVREIRRLREDENLSLRKLGKRFGVHSTTIFDLLKRGRWTAVNALNQRFLKEPTHDER